MKTWKRYARHLSSGEWHVHTAYTDGESTVFELCQRAVDLGLPLIAFTEHVRKKLDYDLYSLLGDIEAAREEFPELTILSGAETRVLPDGSLDVEDAVLEQVDYPIFAFHSFPADRDLYLRCLNTVLEDSRVNAWAHPCVFLRKSGFILSNAELEQLFQRMARREVLLEINGKYCLPGRNWIESARRLGVHTVQGNDIHGPGDFGYRERVW